MPALDTNVLVRYLVQDDAAQSAAARRLIRKCVTGGQTLFIPVTVSLELEWVLRSNFGFGKDAVVKTLSDLLSSVELSFESERAIEVALLLYKEGSADYSDSHFWSTQLGYGADSPGTIGQSLIGPSLRNRSPHFAVSIAMGVRDGAPLSAHWTV